MSEDWQPVTIRHKPRGGVVEAAAKALEDDDPFALMAVPFPVEDGVDPDLELTRCLVEEYALMGWSPERVRELFADELHGKVYDIHQRRGAAFVDEQISEVFHHG
jgi:hypothetical protein